MSPNPKPLLVAFGVCFVAAFALVVTAPAKHQQSAAEFHTLLGGLGTGTQRDLTQGAAVFDIRLGPEAGH